MKPSLVGAVTIALCLTAGCFSCQQIQAEPETAVPVSAQLSPQPSPQTAPPAQAPAQPASLSYQMETYNSTVMGGPRTYGISLPPDYNQHPDRRYPVIFLLHGGHGDQTDWWQAQKGDAIPTLQTLYQQGKLPPSIVVTPDGNDKRGSSPYWDPQYIDGANGNVSTAIGDELIKVIQSRYRTLPAPAFWAIGGLSSGGWGAINVGLHHPNHFSVLFSHSGYFTDNSGPENSPIDYVKTLSPVVQKSLHIYLDCGTGDGEFVKEAREFQQTLNHLQIQNVLYTFPGAHAWSYWRTHLADSLSFVGSQFKSAALVYNVGLSRQ